MIAAGWRKCTLMPLVHPSYLLLRLYVITYKNKEGGCALVILPNSSTATSTRVSKTLMPTACRPFLIVKIVGSSSIYINMPWCNCRMLFAKYAELGMIYECADEKQ